MSIGIGRRFMIWPNRSGGCRMTTNIAVRKRPYAMTRPATTGRAYCRNVRTFTGPPSCSSRYLISRNVEGYGAPAETSRLDRAVEYTCREPDATRDLGRPSQTEPEVQTDQESQ